MTTETLAERLERLRAASQPGQPDELFEFCNYSEALADAYEGGELVTRAEAARLVAEAVEKEREAIAAFIESHAYCTNGGDTCLEPSRFPGMDRHHATIAAAIRARADRQTEGV